MWIKCLISRLVQNILDNFQSLLYFGPFFVTIVCARVECRPCSKIHLVASIGHRLYILTYHKVTKKPRKPQFSLILHFRRLYVHRTCGTDTKQMEFVFNALADIIMESTLSQIGLSWKQENWKSTHDRGFYNRYSDKQMFFVCF